MIALDLIMYLVPLAIGYTTDMIYPRLISGGSVGELFFVGGLLLTAAFLRGLMAHVMIRNFWKAGESVARDLRNALYEKLQHLDISFYDKARVGDLMSRATYDIQQIRNFIAYGIEHRIRIIVVSLTVFGILLWQEWRLALVVYGFLPVFFLLILLFSRLMRTAVERRQAQMGSLNTRLQENITGTRVVKSFSMEDYEIAAFGKENRRMRKADLGVTWLQVHLNAVLLLTDGIGSLLVLLYGGYQVITGGMSLGILLAFLGYLAVMGFPIRILAFNTSLINQARGAGERVLEILRLPDQKRSNSGTRRTPIRGRLEFTDVSFGYTPDTPILKRISFRIEPGEHVAFFGLTGSGKSTLISLIPRFYPPTAGSILLDSRPIEDWDLHFLRSQIGTVLQETFLFSATVGENIAFGRPGADHAAIEEAARHARIHEFICSLPGGYGTPVGEYGVGLSGGQKQRIAIARTLLQDPKLLILDDCTSSLDAVTERRIQAELRGLMRGRTTIIIAQRISTLALADRIIVLEDGAITDIDSHHGLLRKNELYRSIWEAQTVIPGAPPDRQASEV